MQASENYTYMYIEESLAMVVGALLQGYIDRLK
jgi:hypothetical protein